MIEQRTWILLEDPQVDEYLRRPELLANFPLPAVGDLRGVRVTLADGTTRAATYRSPSTEQDALRLILLSAAISADDITARQPVSIEELRVREFVAQQRQREYQQLERLLGGQA